MSFAWSGTDEKNTLLVVYSDFLANVAHPKPNYVKGDGGLVSQTAF